MQSEKNKAIFLDRDGVINEERGDYTWLLEDFKLNKDLIPALQAFQKEGYLLIIISNQGGIGKGMYTKADADYLHLHLERHLENQGIHISEVYYCPHHPDNTKCICRKPDSLLLEKAMARFGIDPKLSWFIGDADRDVEAGTKAGVRTLKVLSNSSLLEILPLILEKSY